MLQFSDLFRVSSPPGLQQAVKVTTEVDLAAGSSPGNRCLFSSSYNSYRGMGSNSCGRARQLMGSGAPWLWQGGWQTLPSVGIVRRAGGSHSNNGSPCWRARKIGRAVTGGGGRLPSNAPLLGRHR